LCQEEYLDYVLSRDLGDFGELESFAQSERAICVSLSETTQGGLSDLHVFT
jgi:hypothetical protein